MIRAKKVDKNKGKCEVRTTKGLEGHAILYKNNLMRWLMSQSDSFSNWSASLFTFSNPKKKKRKKKKKEHKWK